MVVGPVYSSKWYFTNEFIKEEIECCHLNLFLTQYKRSFLANLNYLYINPEYSVYFVLNIVNLFTRLVHFELNILCLEPKAIINLNLPNLQVFSYCTKSGSGNLIIDFSKLNVLCFKDKRENLNLDVYHPDSIIHLETDLNGEKLKVFKNVKYLKAYNYETIDESILSNLPNLKEFDFHQDISASVFSFSFIRIDHIKDCLRRFMNQKRSLKLNELKVFFIGIQLVDNADEINFDGSRQFIDENSEKILMTSYKRLKDNLTFIHEINYSNIFVGVTEIPNDFLKKFNNLSTVRSHRRIVNEEQFLLFLKNIKNLKRLHLLYQNLSQSIYDRLSVSCSLILFELIEEEGHQLNFDFIAKFNELERLDLEQNVSLEVVKSLVGHKSMVKTLNYDNCYYEFKFKNISFNIRKKSRNKFNLKKFRDFVKYNVSSNEIINYFEQLN